VSNGFPRPNRRRVLMMGGAALAAAGAGAYMFYPREIKASGPVKFDKELAIPPLEKGRMVAGERVFDLSIRNGSTVFFEGIRTETMGINADYLAPVLRLRVGEKTRFNVTNTLDEPSTLHWHGFHLPAAAAGGPHQTINPGETWSPGFTITGKASTMWFHSHMMQKTAQQVWAGLAGMVIIDDDEADALDLPREYGVDDIPVVLQDRRFTPEGQMPYILDMPSRMHGMIGNFPMVNGTIGGVFGATTTLVRLRLLNGSNASIYNLRFSDGRTFMQIATDGGLLPAPVRASSLRLAPGERAEIVIDMSDGRTARLINRGNAGGAGSGGGMMGRGGMMGGMGQSMPDFAFFEIRPRKRLRSSPPLPAKLADLPAPNPAPAVRTRRFLLEMGMMGAGFSINGRAMDMNVINEVVKAGETEIWEVTATGMLAHPFHVHNTQFRILDRNGQPPSPAEAGLKDTVLVHPGELVRILVRFDTYRDDRLPYMYHCHILEHEDAGMMGQFTVV